MNELKTESEFKIIGVWGKRHERILKVEHKALYQSLLLAGKLNEHLAMKDKTAENMLLKLM